MSACYNCYIISAVKAAIVNGHLLEQSGLVPQMSSRDEDYESKDRFLNNNDEVLVCYGTTSWGRSQHYLYRHTDRTIYAFYMSGHIGDSQSLLGLRKY